MTQRSIKPSGRLSVRRFNRESGKEQPPISLSNTITTTGRQRFIDLIDGTSSSHLDANSDLRILNTGGSQVKLFTATTSWTGAATGSTMTPSTTYRFDDDTTATYNVDDLYLRFADAVICAQVLNQNVTKPTDENWHYDWTVQFTGNEENKSLGDDGFDDAGLDIVWNLVNGTNTGHLNASNTQFRLYGSDTTTTQQSGSPFTGTTVSQPTSTSLKWSVSVAPASRTWGRVALFQNNANSIYEHVSVADSQNTSETFNYDLTISL